MPPPIGASDSRDGMAARPAVMPVPVSRSKPSDVAGLAFMGFTAAGRRARLRDLGQGRLRVHRALLGPAGAQELAGLSLCQPQHRAGAERAPARGVQFDGLADESQLFLQPAGKAFLAIFPLMSLWVERLDDKIYGTKLTLLQRQVSLQLGSAAAHGAVRRTVGGGRQGALQRAGASWILAAFAPPCHL